MTLVPNDVLFAAVAGERLSRYRAAASSRRVSRTGPTMRVRLGRTLIGLGAALSGDRLERLPRRTTVHPA